MRNIIMVAGQELDINSLLLKHQKELLIFIEFLQYKQEREKRTKCYCQSHSN